MAREADFALKQYQYDKFTIQSALLTYTDFEMSLAVSWEDAADRGQITTWWEDAPGGTVVSSGEEGEKWSVKGAEQIFDRESAAELFRTLAEDVSLPAAFFTGDGTLLYSGIEGLDASFLEELSEDAHVYRFRETPEGSFLLVGSVLERGKLELTAGIWDEGDVGDQGAVEAEGRDREENGPDAAQADVQARPDAGAAAAPDAAQAAVRGMEEAGKEADAQTADLGTAQEGTWYETEGAARDIGAPGDGIRFVTQWDVSKTVRQQEILQQYFLRCYLAAVLVGMGLLGLLSALLTGPLKRMSRAAGRMAQGDYEERLAVKGRDEIGELAESFNRMAEAVEEKVEALSRAAREREDFVANFAHEMKTPMTSIIGYADMLYQRELSRKEVRDASWYIWNEGMRLEALSLKLMDLTVLGRQDFPLQEMAAEELLADAAGGLEPFFAEKGVSFALWADPAYIRVEYDLFKTLLINLLDNSVKAGCTRLALSGTREREGGYRICVRDNGCGMEEEELSRITEAFYMVDKARSRKQHGAGLGLALADRIARIHGSRLEFRSRKGQGTEVSLLFSCAETEMVDEE
ncbi:cell wall metabolism sensor histidine kinase WalK [uncultured Acetatifactor sp.]|uniref:sensor histidine kinase n=1 Tax=uncultured Acetatifactor sp. TaxID=1671927 RepID=UPI00261F92E6|nr:HAMP domain-containing sensor histidine kinase [uncultured Acetatifactor sp.]